MGAIHKILVPIDFSAGATLAMNEALELAKSLGAEVTLLHVYQLPNYVLPDGSAVIATPLAYSELVQAIDAHMCAAVEEASTWQVPVATATREGSAAETIVSHATEGAFDLVVMGTHGRTGVKRLILGSVAEKVVRSSPTPVLTVRQPRAKARAAFSVPVL